MANKEVFDRLETEILNSPISEDEKNRFLKSILRYKNRQANILITGATGCGKSSTINALFNMEKAKVGTGVDPETMQIERYELGNLILWDSPGLGDGKEADEKHSKGIIDMLYKKDDNSSMLIDVVLVILDGGSRDLGTSYELINHVIIPNLADKSRIIIGINQADMVMKGKYWDSAKSQPLEPLQKQLADKALSVKDRVKEGTGVIVEPVCYSAGFKEEGQPQEKPYNLSKLLYYIILSIPEEKRLPVLVESNKDTSMWQSNDNLENYGKEIGQNVGLYLLKDAGIGAASGAALGAAIGSVIPVVGTAIGTAVGAVAGAVVGAAQHIGELFGCYITTATCKALGKPDNCYELNAFRLFRDNWLLKQPEGKEIIAEYYETAPKIVAAIEKESSKDKVYDYIWHNYLSECLFFIEQKRFSDCKSKYMEMVRKLENEFFVSR
jgi:predicted GTPase